VGLGDPCARDRDWDGKKPLMGQHAEEPANPVCQPISQTKILTFRQGKGEKNSAQ